LASDFSDTAELAERQLVDDRGIVFDRAAFLSGLEIVEDLT
jgi:hypothetical protein